MKHILIALGLWYLGFGCVCCGLWQHEIIQIMLGWFGMTFATFYCFVADHAQGGDKK